MHIVVTGGTGFIGSTLVPKLQQAGHSVTVVTRDVEAAKRKLGDIAACTLESLPDSFDGAINLAGSPIDKRWTEVRKRELRESRVETTRRIREAAEQRGARFLISGSALGYYGDRGDEVLSEASPPGEGFLSEVGVAWEAAAQSSTLRVAVVRTGLVLHRDGGALKEMLLPFKLFVGGRLGSGRHWWSWIHRDDICGIFKWAAESEQVSGALNGASPNAVTNAEFTKALGKALGRPAIFPAPAPMLRLVFGEMSEILLASQRAAPVRTLELGYQFKYPDLDAALKAALVE
jgi:uncharacterized protein